MLFAQLAPARGLGLAINDRLVRASKKTISHRGTEAQSRVI